MSLNSAALAGSLGVAAAALVLAVLRRPAYLPSAGWIALMAVPFALQAPTLNATYASIQAFGVLITLVALFASDYLVDRRWSPSGSPLYVSGLITGLLAVGFALPAATHVLLIDHAPLVQVLRDSSTDWQELMILRERSAKLLDAPELLKISFNWAMTIFAPATAIALVIRRRWVAFTATLLAAVVYALLTLAKTPIVMLVYTLAIAAWLQVGGAMRPRLVLIALSCGAVVAAVVWLGMSDPRNFINWRPEPRHLSNATTQAELRDARLHLTLGDYARLRPPEETKGIAPLALRAEYVLYRAFLVPSEMSYRWYQYFSSTEPLGLSGLTPRERSEEDFAHPAQRVAAWALGTRYPNMYPASSRAYASIDADGFARFGLVGVLLAALGLSAARITLGYACRSSRTLPFQAVGLAMLSALPAVGSLGAILISQGFAVLVLCALALEWRESRRRQPATETFRPR